MPRKTSPSAIVELRFGLRRRLSKDCKFVSGRGRRREDEKIYIVEQIRVLGSRPAIGGCNFENPRDRLGLVKSKL